MLRNEHAWQSSRVDTVQHVLCGAQLLWPLTTGFSASRCVAWQHKTSRLAVLVTDGATPRTSQKMSEYVKRCTDERCTQVSATEVGKGSHLGRGTHQVAGLMAAQVRLGVEALGAESAVEGPLARVAAHVSFEVALLVETHRAKLALVRLFACVTLHVPRQVHLLAEGLATHGALVRAL